MIRKAPKINPVTIESEDRIEVECFRFKMDVTKDGYIRICALNPSTIGDVEIIIEGQFSQTIVSREGYRKRKEVLTVFKCNPSKRDSK